MPFFSILKYLSSTGKYFSCHMHLKKESLKKKIGLNEIKATTSTKSYGVPKCRNYFISQFFSKKKIKTTSLGISICMKMS